MAHHTATCQDLIATPQLNDHETGGTRTDKEQAAYGEHVDEERTEELTHRIH
jgi:hypothetical protein